MGHKIEGKKAYETDKEGMVENENVKKNAEL